MTRDFDCWILTPAARTKTRVHLLTIRLADLSLLYALPFLLQHPAALHQVVTDALRVAARQVDLLGVIFQRLDPEVDVRCCSRSVVPHIQPIPGDH